MSLVKIHVLEGQYNTDRLDKVSAAIQAALMKALFENHVVAQPQAAASAWLADRAPPLRSQARYQPR